MHPPEDLLACGGERSELACRLAATVKGNRLSRSRRLIPTATTISGLGESRRLFTSLHPFHSTRPNSLSERPRQVHSPLRFIRDENLLPFTSHILEGRHAPMLMSSATL